MEQVNSNPVLAMLQATAAQLPKTGKGGVDGDFQKLMDKATTKRPDSGKPEEQPTDEPTAAAKGKENPIRQEEEDPVEAAKRMQVFLVPVSPEELSQYPAEWLPQVEPGEPIVCVGVHTGENGEQIPTLVGAKTAEQMYGKKVIAPPQAMDVSDPKADAMLEATDPTVDHSPAALLEKVTAEQFGKEIKQVVQEAQPEAQAKEGDGELELLEVEQAPQKLFHDVEAAPVKVGEVYDAPETEQPNVAQQIDTGLAQALQKGDSLVRIQLNPEHLGSVTIEITQSAEGIIRVALSARSSETRGLLERHAGELQGLLTSRTQQGVEVDVQRQAESQQGQNQQHQSYDGRNGHAQDGQEERRRQHQEQPGSQDFIQQMRLGLITQDGDET